MHVYYSINYLQSGKVWICMKKEQIQGEICMTSVVLKNNILSCSQVPPPTSERRKLLFWWFFDYFFLLLLFILSFFFSDLPPSHWHSLCIDVQIFFFFFFNWYFVFKLIFLKTSNEYSSYSNSLNDNELMGTNLREVASHSTALVMRGSCTYMCVFQQMQLQLSLHCRRWSIVQKKSWCYPTSRKLMITRQNNSKSKWPLFRFGNTEINTVQLVYRCLLAY